MTKSGLIETSADIEPNFPDFNFTKNFRLTVAIAIQQRNAVFERRPVQ